MKNLILIRHAKSSWEAPLHDKDRPLTSQGMQSAHLVSSHAIKYFAFGAVQQKELRKLQ